MSSGSRHLPSRACATLTTRRCRGYRSNRSTAHPTIRRPPDRRTTPASSRTPAGRTRRCTGRSCGRCACSPGSAPPTTPTGDSRRSSRPVATGCRRRSTCRRCWASTPTIRWRSARSAGAAWPSTRSPTWRISTPGIDLGAITTSMTINSPAAVIFAMFVAQAEKAGINRARLGGTLQNDILKEYQAQKEFVFPPRPSMRLVRDTIALHRRRDAALALDLDLRLPHPRGRLDGGRGAGVHAGQRVRLRRAGHAGRPRRSTRSRRGCRSSSTPTSTSSRRSPSTAPPGGSGRAGCATATAPSSSARCSCASTRRRRACR